MEQYAVMNRQKPRFYTPILVLTIVTLVCQVINGIGYHLVWSSISGYRFETLSGENLIEFLVAFAPYISLMVYVLVYHDKGTAMAAITFGLLALSNLWTIVVQGGYGITNLAIYVVLFVVFVLAAVDILTGFAKRILTIIAPAVGFLDVINDLLGFTTWLEWNLESGTYLFLFCNIAGLIAPVALYTTLLLVALRSRTMPAMVTGSTKNAAPAITPEKALRILQEKKDMGLITEEEYWAERMEIINRI